jgi:hypothetical protein
MYPIGLRSALRTLGELATIGAVAMLGGPASAQMSTPVDLELVLAVDVSSSVDSSEFHLQMDGLSEAFRHPAVTAAIRSAGNLGIAVALVQWSDIRQQELAVDWTPVGNIVSSDALAEKIANTPRLIPGGGTALDGAIQFSTQQIDSNRFRSLRKVIDISGDGDGDPGLLSRHMRDRAVARGITINGLAILDNDPMLGRYYRLNVIGGTGAFVMTADDYGDFGNAILRKLIREIVGVPTAAGPPLREKLTAQRTD